MTNREAAWGFGYEDDDKEDMVEKLEVVLSHPVTLSCESNAIPPPKLTWYKDGRKLTSGDGVVLLPGEMGTLSCVTLVKSSDVVVIFMNKWVYPFRRTDASDCQSAER